MSRESSDGRPVGRRPDTMRALKEADRPLTVGELARRIGVHQNTVRFHLRTLLQEGKVRRVEANRGTVGRPPVLFEACPGMDRAGRRSYHLLAEILLDDLETSADASVRAGEAGQTWGRRRSLSMAARSGHEAEKDGAASLIELLDEMGFEPEQDEIDGRVSIGLRHCPFLELTQQRGDDTVCSLHLGLMQGALAVFDPSRSVERLEPFIEPDLCMAHLGETGRTATGRQPGDAPSPAALAAKSGFDLDRRSPGEESKSCVNHF